MDEDVAKLIFVVIMAAGVTAWAVSLSRALRLGRPARQPQPSLSDENAEFSQFEWQTGTVTLRGNREALSKALLRSLAQLQFGFFASIFRMQQYDDGRIVLKKVGPLVCNLPPGLYFTEAEISFQQTNAGTVEASYRVGFGRLLRKLRRITLGIILGIGLPVMLLVGSAVWLFVIPSPMPGLRWQVLQTLQIAHALWPPFLIMWLYSIGRRQSKTLIENVIASTELLQ
ncbi:MAG TPA: hypothetical protein VGP76_22560 [Planctomycetaceae bacterium]|jgi:hypothetical protein|nr:hypothetical protein [Planctomycetaceae bacterium]